MNLSRRRALQFTAAAGVWPVAATLEQVELIVAATIGCGLPAFDENI